MNIYNPSIFLIEDNNPESLKEWIECPYSLTDKLCQAKGNTQLDVLFQNWVKPSWWDKHVLQISDSLVFQRDIIMKSHDTNYWYARTIIPQNCYEVEPDFFKRLDNESIKNLIFKESKVHRISMNSYVIDHQYIEFYWVKKQIPSLEGLLWVRLAQYSFKHTESFYLVEILLPELGNVS